MNLKEIDHAGYINLKEDRHFAYEFSNNELVIHAHGPIPEVENCKTVLAAGYDNKQYLFFSKLPIRIADMGIYPQNYHHPIDWVIKNYHLNSEYTEAVFSFEELQYFCPSTQIVKKENNVVQFSLESREVNSFEISVSGIKCLIKFRVCADGQYSLANSNMKASSEIRVQFEKTSDWDFIEKIYYVVDSVFAFICNRRNTTCTSLKLIGTYPTKTIDNGRIVDAIFSCQSEMYFLNKYRDEPESEKIVGNTIYAAPLFKHIDILFQMIADDVANDDEDKANISLSSIHPSIQRRKLVDLQQSLHITAAFEFYVRRYLPKMAEEKSYHTIIKMLLNEFANKNTGKAKKLALSLESHVISEPALGDKIVKAYKGYNNWAPLKNCLKPEWFKEDEIRVIAKEANDWRNELAHEKRSYAPNEKTIAAVRLIEHLNYAIVLRKIGFEDEEIREIIENVLTR